MCVGLCRQFHHTTLPPTVKPIWPREEQRSQKCLLLSSLRRRWCRCAEGMAVLALPLGQCWSEHIRETPGRACAALRRWWTQVWSRTCFSAAAWVLLSRTFDAFPWALCPSSVPDQWAILWWLSLAAHTSIPAIQKYTIPHQRPHWGRAGDSFGG